MSLTYLSLGAGVQSTALLAMSALGLYNCPRASVAIFADTQDEPQWVYDQLEWLTKWSTIPVEIVTAGRLSDAGNQFLRIPAFTKGENVGIVAGDRGMTRRQCTNEFKLRPIKLRVRELLGLKPRARAKGVRGIALIGISLDEAHRMKPSRDTYLTNTYPLIDAGFKRSDCLALIASLGIPTPKKSACVYCPYHDDHYWRDLKENYPIEFTRAVEYDKRIRNSTKAGIRLPAFVHPSLKPLGEVDFTDPYADQINLNFGNECEGMCGV